MINVVTGGADVGNHLVNHPDVNKVVFTGSIATGKKVMEGASHTLKRVTLELGAMMQASFSRERTSIRCWRSSSGAAFINAGQTCAALKRLYVHEDQYDEVVQKFAAYVARSRWATASTRRI